MPPLRLGLPLRGGDATARVLATDQPRLEGLRRPEYVSDGRFRASSHQLHRQPQHVESRLGEFNLGTHSARPGPSSFKHPLWCFALLAVEHAEVEAAKNVAGAVGR